MLKKLLCVMIMIFFAIAGTGCSEVVKKTKVGVSFGVGGSKRWYNEKAFMEDYAKKLDMEIEVRINTNDKLKPQTEDCIELIDSGVDVLIITPRDTRKMSEVIDYAKKKNVKIISYARAILDSRVDLCIGYDTYKIGQNMGKYLSERVYKGNFIILKGDRWDFNTPLLYNGAKKYIEPMVGAGVNVILDEYVPGWSRDKAREMVKAAVLQNDKQIDAILTPNDGLAGGAAAAIKELGIKNHVVITGMDAEPEAVKRLIAGTQDMTVYMDLKKLAETAMDEAYAMAQNGKMTANAELDIKNGEKVKAYLVTGEMVTKENIDKVLIESGYYTKEQIYGNN